LPLYFKHGYFALTVNKIDESSLAKADEDKKNKKNDKIKSKKSTLRKVGLEPATSPTSGL